MGSLERLDDGIRPAPLEKPFQIDFLSVRLQKRLAVGVALVLLTEILLYAQLMEEGLTLAAWSRFLVPQALVLPFAIRALFHSLRREMGRLELTEDRIRLISPGEETVEVAYTDVAEYRLGKDFTHWFRLRTKNGREFGIPLGSYLQTPEAEAKLIRSLGPRLPSTTVQNRGVPPGDPIELHAWHHFGDPPPVAMERGKRYRYMSPIYLSSAKGDFTLLAPTLAFTLPSYLFLHRIPQSPVLYGVFALHAIFFLYWTIKFGRAYFLWCAGRDRFEVTDEGVRVTRGSHQWILRGEPRPAPAHRFGRSLHQYGRGLHAYFLDPRFLEQDL